MNSNRVFSRRVITGIRPTGRLHLGNLMGAMLPLAALARDPKNFCMFFVANLHGQTTGSNAASAAERLRDVPGIILDYMACGLDHEADNVLIYAQSSVPETSELAWILGCLTPLSELLGMHHFKDKERAVSNPSGGLLMYPALMAADILGPRATLVPVGEDQLEHVELARAIARRFNFHCERPGFFTEPEASEQHLRLPGLKGAGKMGKSEPKGTVNLDDLPGVVKKKILGADKRLPQADAVEPRVGDEPGDPELCRVFRLHRMIGDTQNELEVAAGCRSGTLRCGDCKLKLDHHVNALLAPIQERRRELEAQGGERLALEVLHSHGARMRGIVAPTVEAVKAITGVPTY